MPSAFDAKAPGDLSSLSALVTGASSGIGEGTARLLAAAGARVIMACRDAARGAAAAERIRAHVPHARVEVRLLDLASLASIRRFAEDAPAGPLDLLINNAGVMALPRDTTVDGFELQLATNHLGHFALAGLLLARLLAAPAARVVTVSSTMHRTGRVVWDDLQGERRYRKWAAYSQSKLCNLLFAYELDRRLKRSGARAISLACHPGYAATELQLRGPEREGARVTGLVMKLGRALFAQSALAGALPAVFAATAPGLAGSEYVGPRVFGIWGRPRLARSSAASRDEAAAARLWEISAQLTGVSYAALAAGVREHTA